MAARLAAAGSTGAESRAAALDAARSVAGGLAGAPADLAFLFLSPAHLAQAGEVARIVREELRPRHLLGCVADGVVAGVRELERGPALGVWAASLPGARIETFHTRAEPAGDSIALDGLPDLGGDPGLVAVLADAFSFPADAFLARVNAEQPGLPLVGGVAAGGSFPGSQALILDAELHRDGAVGAVVSGVPVVTVVSQGCAPIGREAVITSAERNIVYELAGEPALERLREEILALPEERQQLAARGVLAGIVIDENRADYGRGDFLMRPLIGADSSTGALALGTNVRVGQTVRFHVRDAASADEDLEAVLADALRLAGGRPAGSLLFTCNGRGSHMFAEADHDARAVARLTGSEAVGGFFCGGEIGPVGDRAFLHGFTATIAVFLDAPENGADR